MLLLLSVFPISGLSAQQDTLLFHGFAFVRKPLADANHYANCLHKKDMKCLRATPEEILVAVRERHPEIRNVAELETYVRSLINVDCPQDSVAMSRLIVEGKRHSVDINSWGRFLRKGEVCLGDPNTGLIEFSLWCGNTFPKEISFSLREDKATPLPVATALPTPQPKAVAKDSSKIVTDKTVAAKDNPAQVLVMQVKSDSTPAPKPHRSFWKSKTFWIGAGTATVFGVVCAFVCKQTVHVENTTFVGRVARPNPIFIGVRFWVP
jgi:hypothetical protein